MTKNSREGNKIRSERYRKNNPDKVKAATQRNRQKKMALVEEFKSSGCSVCGYNKCSQALDLHHLDPSTKQETVANLIYRGGIKRVESELKKCVVLCANCHREHHAGLLDL
jgi:hypothetical protein